MTHILLTNDDGYQAEGLRALAAALEGFATVSIVAPSREQSGTAQSLTLRQPIVCNKIAEHEWAIDGTPADCVIVALHKLLPQKPDMVISGINHGANLGENVYYSGTVGAAREGALHHIPSVAMSLCSKKDKVKFENSARVARAASATSGYTNKNSTKMSSRTRITPRFSPALFPSRRCTSIPRTPNP